MNRRHFLTSLGGGAISFTQGQAAPTDTAAGLQEKLEALRQKHRVPALAAARVRVDGLAIQTVTGFRKAGGSTPVTQADLWHYGSMTKAMTATLLATYVQEGRLHWDDSLGKLIPESCRKAHPRTKDITVLQLLQHRSGLRANLLSWWLLPRADQRGEILRLAAPPGADWPEAGSYLYSNVGYAIAGHLAEKLDGQTWETLLEKRLFRPLKITAGQGPAGTEGKEDQPWPHDSKGQPLPVNGPGCDNPPSLGPAGRVHASLENYARFAADQLRGAAGQPALLPTALYKILHTPDPISHYACGWGIADRPWAAGRCLTHTGSNNANYAAVWLAPEKAFGVFAACNQGGPAAAEACDAACSLMIQHT